MKTILLQFILGLIVVFVFPYILFAQNANQFKSAILDSSSLQIDGTSNLTNFYCIYNGSFIPDTLEHNLILLNNNSVITGDTLKLIINSFDCGKRGINRDFRKTLKSSDFPTIDIMPTGFTSSDSLINKMNIIISLGGVTKSYTLKFESDSLAGSVFRVTGKQKLTITDFNIDPPKALFGLIKVDNELVISFDLFFKHL